jgi:hypothetical protein
MASTNQAVGEGKIRDLSLLMETARDLVSKLGKLADSVERGLIAGTDPDEVIALLTLKKTEVDTLNTVALEITSRLRIGSDGSVDVPVPEELKARFRELMDDFRGLLEQEARIESLIGDRGFPVSRRSR